MRAETANVPIISIDRLEERKVDEEEEKKDEETKVEEEVTLCLPGSNHSIHGTIE